jgi:large subunit ribosomal protein L30
MATYNKSLGADAVDHTAGAHLVVTLVRSGVHAKPKSRGTLRALGLRRIGDTNTLPDRPEIRGMINRVPHLISVDERKGS